jgi:hypothetical protein
MQFRAARFNPCGRVAERVSAKVEKIKGEMKMKKCIIALLAAILMVAAFPLMASASEPPTISVQGSGAIVVAPDMATISLGVTTDANTPIRALEQNNREIEAVLAAIRALGIAEEDISTQHFSVNPRMNWGDWTGTPRIEGFTVNNTLIVTVRDLDRAGEVLGAGISAGTNSSSGIQFGVSNAAELYLEALALAVQDAERKAAALARALGRNVGNVLSVTETGFFHSPVAREFASSDALMAAPAASADVPVQTGEMVITARVQVVYLIR